MHVGLAKIKISSAPTHRRVDEDAVVTQLRVIRRREEGQVAALRPRPGLDLVPIGAAAVHVHVERPPEALVVVLQQVEQAVVALGPEALADEVRAPGPGLREGCVEGACVCWC